MQPSLPSLRPKSNDLTLQHPQVTRLRSAPFAHSLRIFFFNLPVLVLGSSSIISISRGTMNLLIPLLCFAHSMTSSPLRCLPSWTVMKAFGLSPQCESATATTAASRMSGCVASILSKASDEMFSPPTSEISNGNTHVYNAAFGAYH